MTGKPQDGGPLPAAAVSAVIAALAGLIGSHFALLRAEATRAAADTRRAMGLLAVALVLGLVGAILLAGAVVLGLVAAGMHPAWASLAVGVGLIALALGNVQAARWRLRAGNLAPWRSARSLRRTLAALDGHDEKVSEDGQP
ncbi:MAG: phage holin family protein [Rhodobacterales bacterium]|nr:phage holin family protein [Rhodobacterales bacterium]MDX5501816.1 phage holin family protein [Rhodobacterales bacterium]